MCDRWYQDSNISELSSSGKLSTVNEIHPSDSNEMRFSNTEKIRCDHGLSDEGKQEN